MFTIYKDIFVSKFCNHVDGCFEVHIYYAESFFNIYDENVYQINMITLCNWKIHPCFSVPVKSALVETSVEKSLKIMPNLRSIYQTLN